MELLWTGAVHFVGGIWGQECGGFCHNLVGRRVRHVIHIQIHIPHHSMKRLGSRVLNRVHDGMTHEVKPIKISVGCPGHSVDEIGHRKGTPAHEDNE